MGMNENIRKRRVMADDSQREKKSVTRKGGMNLSV